MAGGRPTAGTGPRSPTGGVAEAGEVDGRVQIPIDRWASVTAVVIRSRRRSLVFAPQREHSWVDAKNLGAVTSSVPYQVVL
jgi:hypothetical protein